MMFLMIAVPILFLVIGYFTWSSAKDKYDYNIFNIGVFVRLLIAILLGIFIDPTIGIIMFIIFSIWNFIVTWRNTNLFIGIMAVILQPVALIFVYNALNSLIKSLED
jgi:hypothetical protein